VVGGAADSSTDACSALGVPGARRRLPYGYSLPTAKRLVACLCPLVMITGAGERLRNTFRRRSACRRGILTIGDDFTHLCDRTCQIRHRIDDQLPFELSAHATWRYALPTLTVC
jgi:hypothetical protein